MEGNGEDAGDVGAEALRRASVLRPLVQAYLSRTRSLESGIRDAVWELGVSKTTVWRWIRRLAEEGPELWPKVDGAVKSRFILSAGPSIFGHDYIARQKDR